MKTKREMEKGLKALDEDAAYDLIRYGDIVSESRWTDEAGHYNGDHRVGRIRYSGKEYTIEFWNGRLVSASWDD